MATMPVDHMPTGPYLQQLDLSRVIAKMREGAARTWSPERLNNAETEYRRMLAMKASYPDVALVPSEDVDEVWHTHILHTRQYAGDCQLLFGHFLHHEPNDGTPDTLMAMAAAVASTRALYAQVYGAPSAVSDRCSGKKCHAPTPCRCR